jgi:hypothetical protein
MFEITMHLPDGTAKVVAVNAVPQRGDYCYVPDDKTFFPHDAMYRVMGVEHQIGTWDGSRRSSLIVVYLELK